MQHAEQRNYFCEKKHKKEILFFLFKTENEAKILIFESNGIFEKNSAIRIFPCYFLK